MATEDDFAAFNRRSQYPELSARGEGRGVDAGAMTSGSWSGVRSATKRPCEHLNRLYQHPMAFDLIDMVRQSSGLRGTTIVGQHSGRTQCRDLPLGLAAMSFDINWARYEEWIALAEGSQWRASERDVAASPERRLVVDVIVPSSGPTFSADASHDSGHAQTTSTINTLLAVNAIAWLPAADRELAAARELLAKVARALPDKERAEVNAFLAESIGRFDRMRHDPLTPNEERNNVW